MLTVVGNILDKMTVAMFVLFSSAQINEETGLQSSHKWMTAGLSVTLSAWVVFLLEVLVQLILDRVCSSWTKRSVLRTCQQGIC